MKKIWIENALLGLIALLLSGVLCVKIYSRNASVPDAFAAGASGGADQCAILVGDKTEKIYLINTEKKWIGAYAINRNRILRMVSSREYSPDLAIPTLEETDHEKGRGVERNTIVEWLSKIR
ncbi:MAG: hypothetical protein ABIH86_03260 [Planctomycetota bacterium]